MSPQDRFTEAAANTARERDAWKSKAEKAERERDEAREQRNQAQMTWDDEHDAKLKAERERDEMAASYLERLEAERHNANYELRRAASSQAKFDDLAGRFVALQAENDERRRQLAAVRAGRDNVWKWQGDETDAPDSLVCPVVMTADTLQGFIREVASSQAREQELRLALKDFQAAWIARTEDDTPHLARASQRAKGVLARPSDTSALREFGLKVARAMYVCPGQEPLQKRDEAIVDAVLGAPTSLERK